VLDFMRAGRFDVYNRGRFCRADLGTLAGAREESRSPERANIQRDQ
jgi:hypothetical protein